MRRLSSNSRLKGFAASAALVGVVSLKIRQQADRASHASLVRCIRDGEIFVGNAAGVIL
jgi:hypothetical protein